MDSKEKAHMAAGWIVEALWQAHEGALAGTVDSRKEKETHMAAGRVVQALKQAHEGALARAAAADEGDEPPWPQLHADPIQCHHLRPRREREAHITQLHLQSKQLASRNSICGTTTSHHLWLRWEVEAHVAQLHLWSKELTFN